MRAINTIWWERLGKSLMVFFLAVSVSQVYAKVTPEEAEQLRNGTLTPTGGDPNPNEDGTITAWEGGISTPPEGYAGPPDRYPDIFPEDQKLFTIDINNIEEHREKMTIGHQAMMEKYRDTYKMHVYQTRRTLANPQRVYDWIHKNALSAELTNEGNGFTNAAVGVPFPIPKQGVDPVWNHKTRFRTVGGTRFNIQTPVTTNGSFNPSVLKEDFYFWYSEKGMTPDKVGNMLVYFMQTRLAPARIRGEVILVHETGDQLDDTRKAWLYNPGQRRVRRAPNVGHDNPGPGSDGLRTNDQTDMFNGSLERYSWKLIGKKEMYVPYNAGKLHQAEYTYDDLVEPRHMNQEPVRYELHRVWVVDSELVEGTSHIYGRRTMYIDEDSWQLMAVDVYDRRGELWRVQEAHPMQFALPGNDDAIAQVPILEAIYDMHSNRYLLQAMNNEHEETTLNDWNVKYFTTANMKKIVPK